MKQFPDGFYWGAATAAYQVEGGIENTDWAEAAREGRVPVAGRACDHYHRYEADFDIAKSLGHNAHRFSIEWARIEPEEGKFDEKEIEHYRDVLRALRARNIEPFITLWHFTLPLWFSESGGFERKDAPEIFARYCAYVVSQLGDLCMHFATINEPNVYASLGWMKGVWPPFQRFHVIDWFKSVTYSGNIHAAQPHASIFAPFDFLRISNVLATAHNSAYDAIKKVSPETIVVGIVKHTINFESDGTLLNRIRAAISNYYWTARFMNRVHQKCDAICLNYYHYKKFGDTNEYVKTDMGWNMNPEQIYGALMLLARYQKPLYVSEAGIADADDSHRAEYIRKQIEGTWRAIQNGADVRGHMYWSLLDNYEWAFGYEKRFGLVEIDYDTLERKIRPSAYIYKEICEQNAIE